MTRVTVSARRNLDEPLVAVEPNAPRWKRGLAWTLRSYLILAGLSAVLMGIVALVVLLLL